MRHFQSKNKCINFLLSFGILFFLFSCEREIIEDKINIEGKDYYISSYAKKYIFNVTQTTILMNDNVGMQEEFSLSTNFIYNVKVPTYYYFERFIGTGMYKGTAYFETFGASYISVLNRYFFRYIITGGFDTRLEIKWREDIYDFKTSSFLDNNRFEYNFKTKNVSSKVKPEVNFYDSMLVRNVIYQDVIEIDYSNIENLIDENTPVKSYFSGKSGLIKLILKNGYELERIQ